MNDRNCILSLVPCLLVQALVAMPFSTRLAAQNPVPAQAVPVGAFEVQSDGIAVAPGMGIPSKEKVGGAKQYQLLNLYAIEISRIDTVAKLDDTQKSKLTVGARGLAKEKAQKFARSMDSMMGGVVMPVGGAPALPSKPKADEPPLKLDEVKSYADVDMNTKFMLENGFLPQADHREDADWLKLVQSVLKPEQYVKYEQAIAAQKQIIDKTMVNAGMAMLSVDLVLNKDQESKLTALAMEQLAKPKTESNSGDPAMMSMVVAGMEGLTFFMELAKVDSKKIREVLDPQQFELLDLKLEHCRRIAAEMPPAVIVTP